MTHPIALLWDVDGTLAETERDGHRVAFNLAFEAFGLPWRWDESRYGELLAVSGGRERLLSDMARHGDAPVSLDEREKLARALHERKTAFYVDLVHEGRIPLRPGVQALMEAWTSEGRSMAIASTTTRRNVDALLSVHLGPAWRERFAAVVCGEDVTAKKPNPEVFELALQQLQLGPLQAVAIEDSPAGVAAARAAEVPVIVTRSAYFGQATLEGAIAIGPGLHTRADWRPGLRGEDGPVTVDDLDHWHANMDTVSQFG
jgi:HAD superfamily hydrolase (TIGR01509 family)